MFVEVLSDGVRRPQTDPARMPIGTVLVHPDTARHRPGDPAACRLVKVATTHPGEWPWRRLTGLPVDVPPRGADLSGWRVQPLGDLGLALGHAAVLTGQQVSG